MGRFSWSNMHCYLFVNSKSRIASECTRCRLVKNNKDPLGQLKTDSLSVILKFDRMQASCNISGHKPFRFLEFSISLENFNFRTMNLKDLRKTHSCKFFGNHCQKCPFKVQLSLAGYAQSSVPGELISMSVKCELDRFMENASNSQF